MSSEWVNRQNCKYCSRDCPLLMIDEHTQYPQKVNVWTGIIHDHDYRTLCFRRKPQRGPLLRISFFLEIDCSCIFYQKEETLLILSSKYLFLIFFILGFYFVVHIFSINMIFIFFCREVPILIRLIFVCVDIWRRWFI